MKLIANQINPHFRLTDAIVALGAVVGGKTSDFETQLGTPHFHLTNTARSGLGIIAEVVRPDTHKRIALPAFICAVVATPWLSRGYEIEWIDTDENGLMSVADFEKKIANIGLVVVPHVFGQLAPLAAIYKIAQKHQVFVVEDGAHHISSKIENCDAKILSFGREKVISCVSGGALVWPAKSRFADNFAKYALKSPSLIWQIRHATQPLLFALGQYWWSWGGRFVPGIFRKLNWLPLAVTPAEKIGQEDIPIRALGKVQNRILYRAWKHYARRQLQAQTMAHTWSKTLEKIIPETVQIIIPPNNFRVILKFKTRQQRAQFSGTHFKKNRFNLADWEGVPISPKSVQIEKFGYQPKQCPNAEKYAQTYLTLPTNIWTTENDIKRLEKPH